MNLVDLEVDAFYLFPNIRYFESYLLLQTEILINLFDSSFMDDKQELFIKFQSSFTSVSCSLPRV